MPKISIRNNMDSEEKYIDTEDIPLGTIIDLYGDSGTERLAKANFKRYMFEYFQELNSGQCGWGIDFITWLEISKGWKKEEDNLSSYKRVMSCEEELEDAYSGPYEVIDEVFDDDGNTIKEVHCHRCGSDWTHKEVTHEENIYCPNCPEHKSPYDSLSIKTKSYQLINKKDFNIFVIEMFMWKWTANIYARKARKAGYKATVHKEGGNWLMLGGRWGVYLEKQKET